MLVYIYIMIVIANSRTFAGSNYIGMLYIVYIKSPFAGLKVMEAACCHLSAENDTRSHCPLPVCSLDSTQSVHHADS